MSNPNPFNLTKEYVNTARLFKRFSSEHPNQDDDAFIKRQEDFAARYPDLWPYYSSESKRICQLLTTKEKRKKYYDYVHGPEAKSYVYMVTFTVDPKKPYNESLIEELILKQPRRTEFQTKSAYYVKEYTKAGHPHWHMSIVTGKALRSDAFKYYKNRYGTVDISRSKYNNQADALLYMSKDADPIQMV